MYGYGWIEAVPFVKEPIESIAKTGVEVDLFMPINNVFPRPQFRSSNVKIIPFSFAGRSPWRIVLDLGKWFLLRRYCLVCANPNNPAIYGALLAKLAMLNLVIFSDEIELDPWRLKQHLLKSTFSLSKLIVITDLIRVPVIHDMFAVDSNKFMELPNCSRDDNNQVRHFLVDREMVNILYIGTFVGSFGAEIIAKAIPRLNHCTLTVKEMSARTPELRIMAKILEEAYPVTFRFDHISYDAVDSLINECDIGIVLYTNDDDVNIKYCGKGSGKLCKFLKLGKPVVLKGGSLEWVAEAGAGICVNNEDEFIGAIQAIRDNYQTFSLAARKCYESNFVFTNYYPRVEAAILSLCR